MSAPRESERGVALLLVLWIFMILTVIAAQFSRGMRDDAVTTHNLAEETSARAVAMAGMTRAIYSALRIREQALEAEDLEDDEGDGEVGLDDGADFDYWIPDGTWHEEAYGGGRFAVRAMDEGGKIPLNRADAYLLRRLFQNLGLDTDQQEELADAILDWRDRDTLARLDGAEEEYYLGLAIPYRPKDGPFDSVDELMAVRGMTRELFFGSEEVVFGEDEEPIPLRDVFSVFNRTGNINLRTAPPAVLRALLGGEEEDAVQEILETRDGDVRAALSLMRAKLGDRVLARRIVVRSPTTLAVDARAMMERGNVQARLGAVIEVEEDADGFYVVRWLDRLPAF